MVADVSTALNSKVSSRVPTHQNPKRPPLLPSEADNGPRRPKQREVTSRYLSSISSTSTTSSSATSSSYSCYSNSSSSRRFPSPMVSRTVPMTPASTVARRSQSVERRRPATPRPRTPSNAGEMSTAAKVLVTSARSLSVSFQGESFSLPISKAKPAPVANTSSNTRKGTPERRKTATPVRDQTVRTKTIDQHRWPGRLGQGNSLTRSMDFASEKTKPVGSSTIVGALQKSMIDERSGATVDARLKSDRGNAELQKADKLVEINSSTGPCATSDPIPSDTESISSGSSSGVQECGIAHWPRGIVVPARFWQETNNRLRRVPESSGSPVSKNNGIKPATKKVFNDSSILSPRGISASRGLSSSPLRGAARPSSPGRNVTSSTSSPSRVVPSPSRVRNGATSTLSNNCTNTPFILSFAADARRGKLGENRIIDAHLLRLQYNRQLQWRFVNARADAAMLVQKVTAERSLYNAWVTASKMRHSIKSKRIELQMLRRNLKLHSILKGQMVYLENWDLTDRDHSSSLYGAVAALEASTTRLPVVGGAKADIQNLKDSIYSAVDVMQSMGSSICSLLTKVEHVNLLASELASVTATERASLDQCKDLLSTLTDMQVKDCSLRTHIVQLKRAPSDLITEV